MLGLQENADVQGSHHERRSPDVLYSGGTGYGGAGEW